MLHLVAARRAVRFASTFPKSIAATFVWSILAAACGGNVTTVIEEAGDSGNGSTTDGGRDSSFNPSSDAGTSNDATVTGDASTADANLDPTDAALGDAGHLDAQSDAHDAAVNPFCHPNPANFDIPGNGCDDDDDGTVDNPDTCDLGLAAAGDASAFVKALGLCRTATATGTEWGVISATFTNGHTATTAPNDAQHGILPKFGSVIVPREGTMLGVLSSGGAAENDTDMGPFFKGAKNGMQPSPILPGTGGGSGDAPPGFPRAAPGCGAGAVTTVSDVINAKIQIRVPMNAQGFSFDFDFWSGEWPEYVCSEFNDQFVPLLTSKAFNGGTPTNIAFDANGTAFGTDSAFFDRCTPSSVVSCSGNGADAGAPLAACAGGEAELKGTGFEDPGTWCAPQTTSGGGATGWLTTSAPVQAGEVITLELMIWDTGDVSYDSSVVLDHFVWTHDVAPTVTTRATP